MEPYNNFKATGTPAAIVRDWQVSGAEPDGGLIGSGKAASARHCRVPPIPTDCPPIGGDRQRSLRAWVLNACQGGQRSTIRGKRFLTNTSDSATTMAQRHILLVDDSEPDRLLARAALRKSGVSLHLDCLDNGRDALAWLVNRARSSETRPILVLLDMRMPEWDGLRTLAEIRCHPSIATTPVVFLTALETLDTGPMYEAGVNAYVVKPASLPGLVKFFQDLDDFWFDHITQGDVIGAEMPTP